MSNLQFDDMNLSYKLHIEKLQLIIEQNDNIISELEQIASEINRGDVQIKGTISNIKQLQQEKNEIIEELQNDGMNVSIKKIQIGNIHIGNMNVDIRKI